jgi:hypothetical protein
MLLCLAMRMFLEKEDRSKGFDGGLMHQRNREEGMGSEGSSRMRQQNRSVGDRRRPRITTHNTLQLTYDSRRSPVFLPLGSGL